MTFDPDYSDRPQPLSRQYLIDRGYCCHFGCENCPYTETKVVNLKTEEYDVYIGRAGKGQNGYYGNPHTIGFCQRCDEVHDRNQCIDAFKNEFLHRINNDQEFKAQILKLKGKRLGCFCKPLKCHGNVYKEWLDAQPNLA